MCIIFKYIFTPPTQAISFEGEYACEKYKPSHDSMSEYRLQQGINKTARRVSN